MSLTGGVGDQVHYREWTSWHMDRRVFGFERFPFFLVATTMYLYMTIYRRPDIEKAIASACSSLEILYGSVEPVPKAATLPRCYNTDLTRGSSKTNPYRKSMRYPGKLPRQYLQGFTGHTTGCGQAPEAEVEAPAPPISNAGPR
jgi:hypothetical protein